MPRSAEECRVVPGRGGVDILRSVEESSSAGKGWGRHWGAFKLLYYHCNTTKIDGLWCRGVARSAEECRGVPSAGKGWGRHCGEPLNYSTTIAIPLK